MAIFNIVETKSKETSLSWREGQILVEFCYENCKTKRDGVLMCPRDMGSLSSAS